jgi:class 3 adenylate cyclase
LTVLFCDLVGSTALSEQLDPEEYREVVRAYQETCATVIAHYEGYMAQPLGDGLLVYFGYPQAHENDAERAVRTGLGIVGVIQKLPPRLNIQLPHPLQVRIGIHTGLVVVGEIGSSEKREILALGETPNLAARLQGLAEPDTVVMSTATYRLVQGFFTCHDLGAHSLKGLSDPIQVYRVVSESGVHSRFEVAASTGLTPLVGREHEVRLLLDRWEQAKAGDGQVMLLSGEPGIGKSRLLQVFREQTAGDAQTWIECRCSPYYQNSAFYPVIKHLQRLLEFRREDSPEEKLGKLEATLSSYGFELKETVPLFAALLSLSAERFGLDVPMAMPPILTSQRQKQKTLEALVTWLLKEAERGPVQSAWEDLHWADPSTLELLTLLIDQVPTVRLYLLLTFRPEFRPPWAIRSHLTQITLSTVRSNYAAS